MAVDNLANILGYLGTQFERANAVLFTGAGFSLAAKNIAGEHLPGTLEIRRRLWACCFGDEHFDEHSSLQDLYQMARSNHRQKLVHLLTASLTVDPDSLPEWYQAFYSFPWHRCYTINIDDLAVAIQRKAALPRLLKPISATAPMPTLQTRIAPAGALEVVHLNGTLADLPDNVTFSLSQYAERLSRNDTWYTQLTVDLLSRAVVFVGTELDEPSMWQNIELRKTRGGKSEQQMRPKSYLVTPTLSRARQACLSEYNITWLPLSAEEFYKEVLLQLQNRATIGHQFLKDLIPVRFASLTSIPEVAELAINPKEESEFLFGTEPIWADIQSGRAVERECDSDIIDQATELLKSPKPRGCILITGTAGTGKSTSLKRLALRLSATGQRVAWVDKTTDISPRFIKQTMSSLRPPHILAIDDADMYGAELSSLINEVCYLPTHPLILVAIRSGKVDRALNPVQLEHVPIKEFVIPGLTDHDIDALLDILTKANKLGVLTDRSREQQRQTFQQKCGRQLLVAMIEATSEEPFAQKIGSELDQLDGEAQRIYALVSVATAWRFDLSKNELLLAVGDVTNRVLNALQRLTSRAIIFLTRGQTYMARHRVIAEVVMYQLTESGRLPEVLFGLAFAAATQITDDMPNNARLRRMLQRVLNHEFLLSAIGPVEARHLYGSLEDLLKKEFSFWLHRGCLELEEGNLTFAESCLQNARGLNPSDLNTQTELAHLWFQKALKHPSHSDSIALVEEADKVLSSNIAIRGSKDPNSYHVLGSNMLKWITKAIPTKEAKSKEMQRIIKIIEEGLKWHPNNDHLKILHSNLRDEYLSLAIVK